MQLHELLQNESTQTRRWMATLADAKTGKIQDAYTTVWQSSCGTGLGWEKLEKDAEKGKMLLTTELDGAAQKCTTSGETWLATFGAANLRSTAPIRQNGWKQPTTQNSGKIVESANTTWRWKLEDTEKASTKQKTLQAVLAEAKLDSCPRRVVAYLVNKKMARNVAQLLWKD